MGDIIGPDGSRKAMEPEMAQEVNRNALQWILKTQEMLKQYPVEDVSPVQGGFLDVLNATKRAWWDAPLERLGIWQKMQANKWKNYKQEMDELKK